MENQGQGHPNCPSGVWQDRAPLGSVENPKHTDYFQAKMDAGIAQTKGAIEAHGLAAVLLTNENLPQMRAVFDGMLLGGHMTENDDLQDILIKEDNGRTTTQIVQCNDGDGNPMNVYITKPNDLPEGPQPALIHVHGGGAVLFTTEITCKVGMDKRMAIELNCVVVMPEFRNAPEIKQPKGMQDVQSCVKFIHSNAAEYGIDSSRICLSGQSGGSFLALGASLIMAKANECEMMKALFLMCPMISYHYKDCPQEDIHQWEKDMMFLEFSEALFGFNATDLEKQFAENDPHIVPGRCPLEECKKLPPTAIFTSECDSVRGDARMFAEKMKKTDKFLGLHDMPGVPHGYEVHFKQPETIAFWQDTRKAFDAWVRN